MFGRSGATLKVESGVKQVKIVETHSKTMGCKRGSSVSRKYQTGGFAFCLSLFQLKCQAVTFSFWGTIRLWESNWHSISFFGNLLFGGLPSLKLTAHTWKWMCGRGSFHFRAKRPYFQVRTGSSFQGGSCFFSSKFQVKQNQALAHLSWSPYTAQGPLRVDRGILPVTHQSGATSALFDRYL